MPCAANGYKGSYPTTPVEHTRIMLNIGLARKVTIHLNEDTTALHDFLYNELFAFLFEQGVAGASLVRPSAGFGSHHRVHSTSASTPGSDHLPIRIEFIESREKVDALMPRLCELITDGLIEAHDTTIYRSVKESQ